MIVSHERAVELLTDLRANGPATARELAARLRWDLRITTATLEAVRTTGVLDYEPTSSTTTSERVWKVDPC